jgi:hypothetical protein
MVYVRDHVGNYNWIFIMAPIFGGAIAGYCARLYEDRQSEPSFIEGVGQSRAGTIMERSVE